VALVIIVALVLCVWRFLAAIAPVGTGFVAKTLCSAVFVSKRDPASVQAEEFTGLSPLISLVKFQLDRKRQVVEASLLGIAPQRAIFRPGMGCTIFAPESTSYESPMAPPSPRLTTGEDPLDLGVVATPGGVDVKHLREAFDRAFDEAGRRVPLHTRALLVVKDGRLIGERYGKNITPYTPLCGQSISKAITAALASILIDRGMLELDGPAPVEEWSDHADPRRQILTKHLLAMTSGLHWTEDSNNPFSDLVKMLFFNRDMAAFAASHKLRHEPGMVFQYCSGNTNILSRGLLKAMGGDKKAYLSLPREALFTPSGMQSAIFEADAAGTLVGSSYVYATARDFARFGELYLYDGARNHNQILPNGWVNYSATPAPTAPQGCYGASIWLNKGSAHSAALPRPSLPSDLMLMNGSFGQFVAVIPSRNLVIVRLGETHNWDIDRDPDPLIADLLKAVHRV